MSKELAILNKSQIKDKIYTIRGMQVMLDSDLSQLYGVKSKVLNQAVKRNINRFPSNFMFQLTDLEYNLLKSQFATLEDESCLRSQSVTLETNTNLRFQIGTLKKQRGKHRKYLPYVFTEQGVAMLSSVLKSETAIMVSIQIMDAFVTMRKFISQVGRLAFYLRNRRRSEFIRVPGGWYANGSRYPWPISCFLL